MQIRNARSIFPDSFILVIGFIPNSFHLPYGQTDGIIKVTGKKSTQSFKLLSHVSNSHTKKCFHIEEQRIFFKLSDKKLV